MDVYSYLHVGLGGFVGHALEAFAIDALNLSYCNKGFRVNLFDKARYLYTLAHACNDYEYLSILPRVASLTMQYRTATMQALGDSLVNLCILGAKDHDLYALPVVADVPVERLRYYDYLQDREHELIECLSYR